MSREREEFVALAAAEGVPVGVAQRLMAAARTLHRIAELECSSEEADRDRVPCPKQKAKTDAGCLCRDFGDYHDAAGRHGAVPRIAVQGYRLERRVEVLLQPYGAQPIFQGDPRGPALILKVPSGKTDDWEGRGICVPQSGR